MPEINLPTSSGNDDTTQNKKGSSSNVKEPVVQPKSSSVSDNPKSSDQSTTQNNRNEPDSNDNNVSPNDTNSASDGNSQVPPLQPSPTQNMNSQQLAPNQPQTPPPIDPWVDPWGGNQQSQTPSMPNQANKMSPKERVAMIETVYQNVLGRKPDTRDINYYKYSTLSAEEIQQQLLEGKEHEKLIEDGRDYKKAKERAEVAELRVKELEMQIKDQIDEYKHLSDLLKEKNSLIQQLRSEISDPYNFSGIEPNTPQQQQPIQQLNTQSNNIDSVQGGSEAGSFNSPPPDSSISTQYDTSPPPQNGRKIIPPKYNDESADVSVDPLPNQQISNGSYGNQISERQQNDHPDPQPPVQPIQNDTYSDPTPQQPVDNNPPQPDQAENNISSPKAEEKESNPNSDQQSGDPIDKDEYVGFFENSLDGAFKVLDRKPKLSDSQHEERTDIDDSGSTSSPTTVPSTPPVTVSNQEAYSSLDANVTEDPSAKPETMNQPEPVPTAPANQPQPSAQSFPTQTPTEVAPAPQYQQAPNKGPNMVFSSPTFDGEPKQPVQEQKASTKNKGIEMLDKIVDKFSP